LHKPALLILAAATASVAHSADVKPRYGAPPPDLDKHLARLVAAYPDTIAGFDAVHLKLKDGRRLPISDGRTDKSFDQLLDDPDIDDMFAFAYSAGEPPSAPPANFDPGRVRVDALFKALYGNCEAGEVSPHMRAIQWLPRNKGGSVRFTTAQGADKALEAVSRELDELPSKFLKYLKPTAGTYNCRPIAGTGRMSMHGFGAAIDINVDFSDYWRWANPRPDGSYAWKNRIPVEIVDVFERHGFVWGGRWHHYDTMHFEHRPDLVPPQR
jgi:hypothetical protein